MPVSRRDICQTLLGVLLWLPQASSAVDLVSSASRVALPPLDDDGITMVLDVGDARINLFIEGRPFELSQNQLQGWVQRSADIVADYYGSFPVEETWVAIRGARGGRVMNGQATTTSAGIVINVSVGLMATPEALADDWIMVHELIHLAFPRVSRRHHWIEEGLSVYVESIARASVGDISDDEVWAGFLDGMPKGLPGADDKGLDNTATWGRTYWGGALYALLTDIRIREQTNGEKTLRDALRAIVNAGYNMTKFADLREVLTTGDEAIGVPVLVDVYDEMRDQPVPEEIDSLWINLGVADQGGKIIYNDDAPMFGIRQALTQ
jgi:hypothetical protein